MEATGNKAIDTAISEARALHEGPAENTRMITFGPHNDHEAFHTAMAALKGWEVKLLMSDGEIIPARIHAVDWEGRAVDYYRVYPETESVSMNRRMVQTVPGGRYLIGVSA